MKKIITEKKEVTKIEDVVIKEEVYCDECGKLIQPQKWFFGETVYKGFTVITHHSDWGNDSVDSYQHLDICSKECLHKNISEYYKGDYSNTAEYEIRPKTIICEDK